MLGLCAQPCPLGLLSSTLMICSLVQLRKADLCPSHTGVSVLFFGSFTYDLYNFSLLKLFMRREHIVEKEKWQYSFYGKGGQDRFSQNPTQREQRRSHSSRRTLNASVKV